MPKIYPMELRIKILEEYYAGGISQRNIAKKYEVSKSWIYKLLRGEKRKKYKAVELERNANRHLYIIRDNS